MRKLFGDRRPRFPFEGSVMGVCRKCGRGYNRPKYDGVLDILTFKCDCGFGWSEPSSDREMP